MQSRQDRTPRGSAPQEPEPRTTGATADQLTSLRSHVITLTPRLCSERQRSKGSGERECKNGLKGKFWPFPRKILGTWSPKFQVCIRLCWAWSMEPGLPKTLRGPCSMPHSRGWGRRSGWEGVLLKRALVPLSFSSQVLTPFLKRPVSTCLSPSISSYPGHTQTDDTCHPCFPSLNVLFSHGKVPRLPEAGRR